MRTGTALFLIFFIVLLQVRFMPEKIGRNIGEAVYAYKTEVMFPDGLCSKITTQEKPE